MLTVTHQAEHPVGFAVPLSGQSHTDAYCQTVAQRSGIHFYTRHLVVRMPDQPGTEPAEGRKLLLREEAKISENAP
ncbi:hypothetical protein D3C71_1923200 [compost metagenome]